MLVGEAGPPAVPASAPDVRIINLSLGEPKRRFAGMVSPWARLLDRFAFDYRLLILVSAGNIADRLPVPGVGDTRPNSRTWTRRSAHRWCCRP